MVGSQAIARPEVIFDCFCEYVLAVAMNRLATLYGMLRVNFLTLLVPCTLDTNSSGNALVADLKVSKCNATGLVLVEGCGESVTLRNILILTDAPIESN
jgi:hypothetical protein